MNHSILLIVDLNELSKTTGVIVVRSFSIPERL